MSIFAWHFVRDDGRLRQPVNGVTHVEPGLVLTHDGPLVLCASGLHASRCPLDALQFAPGALLCRVRCSGEIIEGFDKLVCSRRRVEWTLDATHALHEWACWCAEQVVHLCGDDPRPRAAIEAKRAWLRGEITDKELVAAGAAARAAAAHRAAAAAWAAMSARWAAGTHRAGGVAWDAAGAAARAVRDAARAAQRKALVRIINAQPWEDAS